MEFTLLILFSLFESIGTFNNGEQGGGFIMYKVYINLIEGIAQVSGPHTQKREEEDEYPLSTIWVKTKEEADYIASSYTT